MRKIIILFLLCYCLPLYALENFQIEKPIETDGYKILTKEFCFIEWQEIDYVKKEDFYLKNYDLEDYIIEYSDWQKEKPIHNNYVKKEQYYYQKLQKFRYIHITNTTSPIDQFLLNELIIKNNNEILSYNITCENCSNSNYNYINNGNKYNEGFYIIGEEEIIIDLGNYYNLADITYQMYLSNYFSGANNYQILTSIDQGEKLTKIFIRTWFTTPVDGYKLYEHQLPDAKIYEAAYGEKITIAEFEESTISRRVSKEQLYQEEIKLYKNYQTNTKQVTKEESDYCQTMYRLEKKNEEEIIEIADIAFEETEPFENKSAVKTTNILDFYEKENNEKQSETNEKKDYQLKDNKIFKKIPFYISILPIIIFLWIIRKYVRN